MNITFLVGNGFDISAGVDTSYTGFYEWYCSLCDDDSECIKNFKKNILSDNSKNNDEKYWSDFELGLGKYTQEFTKENINNFIECYDDALTKLQDYIQMKVEQFYQEKSSIIQIVRKEKSPQEQKLEFATAFLNFYNELSDNEQKNLNNIFPHNINEKINIRFISFNYTNILDYYIEGCCKDIEISWYDKKTDDLKYDVEVDTNVLHVHGQLNHGILLGLDSEYQIFNKDLQNESEITDVIIKPTISKLLGTYIQDNAKEYIKSSNIVCLYGLSIGNTDAQWWEFIMDWLQDSKDNHLVIFWYTGKKNIKKSLVKYLQTIKEIKEKITSHSSLTAQQIKDINDQIHVIFDTDTVLNVKKIKNTLIAKSIKNRIVD